MNPAAAVLRHGGNVVANQLGNILRGDVVIEASAKEGVTHPVRPGMERVALGSKVEALVYVLAHETRHMCQHHERMGQSTFPTGYARNSCGQFSEVDTEAFAVNRLRAWRRAQEEPQESLRAGCDGLIDRLVCSPHFRCIIYCMIAY